MTQTNVAQTLDEAQEHRSGIGTEDPGSPRPSVLAAAGGFPHAVGAEVRQRCWLSWRTDGLRSAVRNPGTPATTSAGQPRHSQPRRTRPGHRTVRRTTPPPPKTAPGAAPRAEVKHLQPDRVVGLKAHIDQLRSLQRPRAIAFACQRQGPADGQRQRLARCLGGTGIRRGDHPEPAQVSVSAALRWPGVSPGGLFMGRRACLHRETPDSSPPQRPYRRHHQQLRHGGERSQPWTRSAWSSPSSRPDCGRQRLHAGTGNRRSAFGAANRNRQGGLAPRPHARGDLLASGAIRPCPAMGISRPGPRPCTPDHVICEGQVMFPDCPAYLDEDGARRCGLPA